ncbi:MAG: hypothetical protein LQ338_007819 [Usnochroma carphineum]|nr:MAG: hypothetical protein LQ338_007819 [Usnochroma carphineum]
MAEVSGPPPALSTPATHIFENDVVPLENPPDPLRSPEQIYIQYEIGRTVAEIKRGKWKRIALQFPDSMLQDAPMVFEQLSRRLSESREPDTEDGGTRSGLPFSTLEKSAPATQGPDSPRLFILADTSYGACCVDEIAAEHVNADVVVHYGRACLSATARLPVVHVFTKQPLAIDSVVETFKSTYQDHDQPVILMSDVTYASHMPHISANLEAQGYSSVFTPSVVHNPASPLPNRTVPEGVNLNPEKLREWRMFHISSPPDSLLLTLSSRVSSIHIFPTDTASAIQGAAAPAAAITIPLRRRYALLTSVSTVPIFGILINTLSVKNYLHIVDHVQSSIRAAGKKSYTFVVGKINAAKVANFSEIGAWVVIGCWESSLIDSKEFWKPILTPFELELALASDDKRIWTGEWKSDFQSILEGARRHAVDSDNTAARTNDHQSVSGADVHEGDLDSEPESAPPEFDLRAGRYVSQSRPMQAPRSVDGPNGNNSSQPNGENALVKRMKGDIMTIGNQASPGAEFLQSKRTWKGLGSDLEIEYDRSEDGDGVAVEEGRSGIASGYHNAYSTTRA